jgi:hypothetical protein
MDAGKLIFLNLLFEKANLSICCKQEGFSNTTETSDLHDAKLDWRKTETKAEMITDSEFPKNQEIA